MNLLRSTLFAIIQVFLTILFSLLALLTFPIKPYARYRIIFLWNHIVVRLARAICGIRYEIKGLENMPDHPVIVMSKHQSAWETIALPTLFPPMSIVIKKELLMIPFFGWGMRMASPIAIDRKAGKEALKHIVAQGRERIAEGFWVLIFPEGTRVKAGEVGRYGIGGAWLATHTNTPVLPVAHNAGEVWPKNSFLKRPGTVTVSIGPVISSEGKKADALNEEVKNWIETEMKQLPHA
ncbi:MAG: 1-acyl-sn-glycerol-3-phosphate acyltransferase [Hydrogenophilaceae bacterium]|nr:1-acyl-sn-glycerol-3-phosphate acyltransferase [Hydrogenophilaceae bacterium]